MPTDRSSPSLVDRAGGYLTEIRYPFHYEERTNPLYMRLALLRGGLQPPDVATACELGFGQGGNILINAAAGTAQWLGNDVNPDHLLRARALAERAGIPVGLDGDSFAEFARRDDLPDLDFVAVSGVWSWVSDGNRQAIVDFARRRLAPGGVLYVGYAALPGLAAFGPIRHLMAQHGIRSGSRADAVERVNRSIAFVNRLLGTSPAYVQQHPRIPDAVRRLSTWDPRDLAHDYFSRDWRPMHFADVASLLVDAGFTYGGQAGHGATVESLLIEPPQQALLDGIEDPVLRETVRDFLLNRSSRHDYWIQGPVKRVSNPRDALRRERILFVGHRPELPFEIRAPLKLRGQGPDDSTLTAILHRLAGRQPLSLGDLETGLGGRATLEEIVEAVSLLLDCDLAAQVQPEAATLLARPRTERFNALVLQDIEAGGEIRHLASPVLAGGFRVGLPEQLFLRAWQAGQVSPDAWVRTASRSLAAMAASGLAVPAVEELARRAVAFEETGLPLLKSLMIA